MQHRFDVKNFTLEDSKFNSEIFNFDLINQTTMLIEGLSFDRNSLVFPYSFSRVSKFILPLKLLELKTDSSKLLLHKTSINYCSLSNFGVLYSTILVEIIDMVISNNNFSTEGSLQLFILEKTVLAQDMKFTKNIGPNSTLFQIYNQYQTKDT